MKLIFKVESGVDDAFFNEIVFYLVVLPFIFTNHI